MHFWHLFFIAQLNLSCMFLYSEKDFKQKDHFEIYYRLPFCLISGFCHSKSGTLVFAACLSPTFISSSFFTPSIPFLHQVPARQCELSWQPAAQKQTELQCQLVEASFSTPCHRRNEGRSRWQKKNVVGGKGKGSLNLSFPLGNRAKTVANTSMVGEWD